MIAPALPERIGRVLPLLGSDKPNEVANACGVILRDLGTVGLDWHGVQLVPKTPHRAPPPPSPMPNFFDMARACRDHYGDYLTEWEWGFVANMCRRASPTSKEMARLASIFARVSRRAAA